MKYLLKTADTYRVDTLDEVEKLRAAMENDNWFSVDSFSYAYKVNKKTGDEYYLVTVKKGITDEKDPDRYVKVSYEIDA